MPESSDSKTAVPKARKPYQKAAIVFTEKVETRAVQCAKANDTCGPTGPLLS
jgi:hypothetical protein